MEQLTLDDDIDLVARTYVDSGALRFRVPFSNDEAYSKVSEVIRGEHTGISYHNMWVIKADDGEIESFLCVCDYSKLYARAAVKEASANVGDRIQTKSFIKSYKRWLESSAPDSIHGRDICILVCESTEKYRGQGFPKVLLGQYCEMARKEGLCDSLYGDVPINNQRVMDNFISVGFRKERLIDTSALMEPVIRVTIDLNRLSRTI